jgi:hypothetical protein
MNAPPRRLSVARPSALGRRLVAEAKLASSGGMMMRRSAVLIVVVGAALALPAQGNAVDRIVLDISPTRIAVPVSAKASSQERARVKALAAWRLDGRVVGRDFYRLGDAEIFGVSLSRSFPLGRGDELHAFRAAPKQTVTFDGQRGRWEARFGNALTLSMEIMGTGAQQPTDPPLPCRGAFTKVPVSLRGTFVLRTGTKFFRTIRRVNLTGLVTFAAAGPIDCTPLPSPVCGLSSTLSLSHRFSRTSDATLLMSPGEKGWTTLSFADRSAASSAGYTWYHVMFALGSNPLSGQPPTIAARLASPLPIQGSGTFRAQQTSTETNGACSTVLTTGTFDGMFRARFAGWGTRSVRLNPADDARYREDR